MTSLRLRRQRLEWRLVDDEVVALDLETAQYLSTNRAGALLWDELATGATRVELISRLVTTWGIDEAQAATDTDAFLAALNERGLLESV